MKDFKIKYNIDNDLYRLGKEIIIVKYDIDLLEKAINITTDFLQLKLSMIDTPYEYDRFEELLVKQHNSLNKKKEKLKELEMEEELLKTNPETSNITKFYHQVLENKRKLLEEEENNDN